MKSVSEGKPRVESEGEVIEEKRTMWGRCDAVEVTNVRFFEVKMMQMFAVYIT